jgi:4-methyl-5(b-hydroxyethyl)-thiazole monophosphate biosynthesis
MAKSYVFLAEGFEEIEALATVDLLRRGGMDVATMSITANRQVKGANGITVMADYSLTTTDPNPAEWLIMPGGMPGATNLATCPALGEAVKQHYADGGKVAAICAAPAVVLFPLGLLDGRRATCYPGFETVCPGATLTGRRLEIDDRVITANGPSTAFDFALAILADSQGEDVARQVSQGTLYYSAKE